MFSSTQLQTMTLPDLAQNRHIEARASRADVLEDDP